MKVPTLAFLALTIVAPLSFAQSADKGKKADDDWANVIALTKPATPTTAPGSKKTAIQVENERVQKASTSRQAAQAAKDFYVANPTHVYAPDAKKIEALQSLLGITETDKSQDQVALQTAKTYRDNKNNPASARFEVALLAERVQAKSKLGGQVFGNHPAELEKIADKLRVEFGDIAEVFNFYVSVARGADMVAAQALATKIVQWPAGKDAKAEAQSILARQALVNKPLNWTLTELDKKEPLDLAQQTGNPTLIYISSFDEDSAPFPGLDRFKKTVPAGVKVIYLVLGATGDQMRSLKSSAPIAGTYCYETRGALGPTAEQFHIRHTPFVFALNRAGLLVGFGPASELPSLLSRAVR